MPPQGDPLSASAREVQRALDACGLEFHVRELPASTRTASDAAKAIGCSIGQIAKSLVFCIQASGEPLLVITSGIHRVDEASLSKQLDQALGIADADYVRAVTGFSIGGVPPIGHRKSIRTILDSTLQQYEQIWAAAGTPHAVFPLSPEALAQITRGEWMQVN